MENRAEKDRLAAYMRAYNKTPRGGIYQCWKHLVERCCNPANRDYPRYGGRGISVCPEWLVFERFFEWAVSGWKVGLQIDRKNNNSGYHPENCHWVTSRQNNRNRRNNKLDVEKVAEIKRLLAEGVAGPKIAKKFGVHHSLIYRIKSGQQWL